jgi:hypothetical protein
MGQTNQLYVDEHLFVIFCVHVLACTSQYVHVHVIARARACVCVCVCGLQQDFKRVCSSVCNSASSTTPSIPSSSCCSNPMLHLLHHLVLVPLAVVEGR